MKVTRRTALASLAGTVVRGAGQRPNILFLFTDQQSSRALGAAGNRWVRTPNLDALARSGVRFSESYCASPVCSPSRASLVTGMMPHQAGVNYNPGARLNAEVPTMGEIFRAAGYETGWAGKWHLPTPYPGLAKPEDRRQAEAQVRGFEVLPLTGEEARRYSPFGDFTDEPTAEAAIRFLERKRDKPFLLGVSVHNPHDICYYVMDKLPEAHPDRGIRRHDQESEYPPLPANHRRDPAEPEFISQCRERTYYGDENTYTRGWDERMWRSYLWTYYRMTERVDRVCGRVLDALRNLGLAENTLVVFTSDHGEGMAAHRWVVKLMLWEEPVTVPLIVSWPGRIPGGKVDSTHPVSGIDVLPTLCDYAGITPPKPLEGVSLRPWIEGGKGPDREFVVSELAPDTQRRDFLGRMVRTRRYKYIAFSHGRRRELLFDLEADPGEQHDLAQSKAHARELERHRSLLARWQKATNDAFRFVPTAL